MKSKTTSKLIRHILAPLLCLLLLGGVFGLSAMRRSPADTADYHQETRQAINDVPRVIGDWVGRDVPVPAAARELLRPNALICRQYTHTQTQQSVTLLIVQTIDARDLVGHYPPVCYPGSGWELVDTQTAPFPAVETQSERRIYTFERGMFAQTQTLQVQNLMVLPTGRETTTMQSVNDVANQYVVRYFGAAELQLVTQDPLSPDRRDEVWQTFYEACQPAIELIKSGGQQASPILTGEGRESEESA